MAKKAITLWYSYDMGSLVETEVHKSFQELDSLMEADILQDCLRELNGLYNRAIGTYFGEDIHKMAEGEKHD